MTSRATESHAKVFTERLGQCEDDAGVPPNLGYRHLVAGLAQVRVGGKTPEGSVVEKRPESGIVDAEAES